MKFSVALESNRAAASALLAIECIWNLIVIDLRADIYAFWSLLCLISANLIKHWENPLWCPWNWPVLPSHLETWH
jgi:hypothetical protein